jgi:hypothetical protein
MTMHGEGELTFEETLIKYLNKESLNNITGAVFTIEIIVKKFTQTKKEKE